jgi:hypothetical protein
MKITEEMITAAARAMYELDPLIESGEFIDGFQVSPSGPYRWDQIVEMDIAEEWRKQARAGLEAALASAHCEEGTS